MVARCSSRPHGPPLARAGRNGRGRRRRRRRLGAGPREAAPPLFSARGRAARARQAEGRGRGRARTPRVTRAGSRLRGRRLRSGGGGRDLARLGSQPGSCGPRRRAEAGAGRAAPHLTAGGARGPQHVPRGEGSPPARGLRRRRPEEATCTCPARLRGRGRREVPAASGRAFFAGPRPPAAAAGPSRSGGVGAPTWRPGAPRTATCGSSGCTATGATSAATTSTTRRPRRSCTSWRASAWCTARGSTGRSSTGDTATTSSGTGGGGGRQPCEPLAELALARRSGRLP